MFTPRGFEAGYLIGRITMAAGARLFLALGGATALLAVALGAFGAHALKGRVTPEMLAVWHTGIEYHVFHALGLLAVGLVAAQLPDSAALKWSGWLMLAGIVLFSGSLYALALSGERWLGAVTPVGGVAFLAAWALFIAAAVRA
jgi:uncharacterized membrane protein YgdD (TMEM256/DUF423 family)